MVSDSQDPGSTGALTSPTANVNGIANFWKGARPSPSHPVHLPQVTPEMLSAWPWLAKSARRYQQLGRASGHVRLCKQCGIALSPAYPAVPPTDFDLEAVRAKLDEQGMTIAANQEASIKSRRKLADVTKSALLFRASA